MAKQTKKKVTHTGDGARTRRILTDPAGDKIKIERGPFRVMATSMGYYDLKRRRIGDVFTVRGPLFEDGEVVRRPGGPIVTDFSPKWMERVPQNTPERITTGQQQLARDHDDLLKSRSPALIVNDEPDADKNPLSS